MCEDGNWGDQKFFIKGEVYKVMDYYIMSSTSLASSLLTVTSGDVAAVKFTGVITVRRHKDYVLFSIVRV